MQRKSGSSGTGKPGLEVRPGLSIPDAELQIRRTRSGGPGGQNVNKVSTRVEVYFDVAGSEVLSVDQKQRILTRLAARLSKDGVLRVVSQAERTQGRNEAQARRRLAELLARALERPRRRRATRPTRGAVEKRVETKKQRAALKRGRRKPSPDE